MLSTGGGGAAVSPAVRRVLPLGSSATAVAGQLSRRSGRSMDAGPRTAVPTSTSAVTRSAGLPGALGWALVDDESSGASTPVGEGSDATTSRGTDTSTASTPVHTGSTRVVPSTPSSCQAAPGATEPVTARSPKRPSTYSLKSGCFGQRRAAVMVRIANPPSAVTRLEARQ